jgi:hypothetical protein
MSRKPTVSWLPIRPLSAAVLAAAVLTACGFIEGVVNPCAMQPQASVPLAVRIGPAKALATSCAAMAEVDGRTYAIGVGRWLDEDALVLEEYAPVTKASYVLEHPTAYALAGVDPNAFLVVEAYEGADPQMGAYMALWRETFAPPGICRYADRTDPQYPVDACGTD